MIESGLQAAGELVVGESMKHAFTSGTAECGASLRIIHESVDRCGNRVHIARVIEDESGTAIENSLGRTSTSPCERGHTSTGGLEKHDAESLLLKTCPAIPAQHGEEIDSTMEFGQFIVGDPPEETHRT
jgi:hypothetical protein